MSHPAEAPAKPLRFVPGDAHHAHEHVHDHGHAHDPRVIHVPGVSLLRLSVASRLIGALGLSGLLWLGVLWALA